MKQTTKYWLCLLFFLLALLVAGTADFNEAKETETYQKQQTK